MQEKEFTVVLRGSSAVYTPSKKGFEINNFPSSAGLVNINFRSRWIQKNENTKVPGDLWIEVKGKGKNLYESLAPFANAGGALIPILSISANAAINDPELELAYDSSPQSSERDYFQHYVPPESGEIHILRQIKSKETIDLIESLSRSVNAERINRAINHYRLSLSFWRFGKETFSLAHLWMALEALTRSRIKRELTQRSLKTNQDLAGVLGTQVDELDPTVKRELILKGDQECYSKSKKASDGFEHGFLEFEEIQELATDTRTKMAQYIRDEIFNQLELNENTFKILTKEPFEKPLGYWPVVKNIRGKLLGNNPELALEGNEYPIFRWSPTIQWNNHGLTNSTGEA